MTMKSATLAAVLAGALMVPAFAFAQDAEKAPIDGKRPPMHHKAFEGADTNKDGALSLDEFLERHKQKFAEIDTDKNGSLSPEELKAHGETRKDRWEKHKGEKKTEEKKAE